MNCSLKTCIPQMMFTALIIVGIWLGAYVLIYLYIMYDTYRYHSSDLKAWRTEKINNIESNKAKVDAKMEASISALEGSDITNPIGDNAGSSATESFINNNEYMNNDKDMNNEYMNNGEDINNGEDNGFFESFLGFNNYYIEPFSDFTEEEMKKLNNMSNNCEKGLCKKDINPNYVLYNSAFNSINSFPSRNNDIDYSQ